MCLASRICAPFFLCVIVLRVVNVRNEGNVPVGEARVPIGNKTPILGNDAIRRASDSHG